MSLNDNEVVKKNTLLKKIKKLKQLNLVKSKGRQRRKCWD